MSSKIDVLMPGYANEVQLETGKFMRATGSSCLVRSNNFNILFDTMGPWERNILCDNLAKLKLHPDDINYVVCSHSHPDHIGNLNLFTKKALQHFVGTSVYVNDLYDLNCFEPIGSYEFKLHGGDKIDVIQYQDKSLTPDVSLKATHGHTLECISMLIENCDTYGTVALVGDLFEREQDVEDESIWLSAGSQSPDIQRANRSYIYKRVDYILPGHGPLFRTSNKGVLHA